MALDGLSPNRLKRLAQVARRATGPGPAADAGGARRWLAASLPSRVDHRQGLKPSASIVLMSGWGFAESLLVALLLLAPSWSLQVVSQLQSWRGPIGGIASAISLDTRPATSHKNFACSSPDEFHS